jgi:hypothetical protein
MELASLPFELDTDATASEPSTLRRVVVHIQLSKPDFGTLHDRDALFALIDEIVRVLEIQRVGEIIDDVWGHGFCSLHVVGPDPVRLCSVLRDVLCNTELPGGFVFEVPCNSHDLDTRGAA